MIIFTLLGIIAFVYMLIGVFHLIRLVNASDFEWKELLNDPALAFLVILLWPMEYIE